MSTENSWIIWLTQQGGESFLGLSPKRGLTAAFVSRENSNLMGLMALVSG